MFPLSFEPVELTIYEVKQMMLDLDTDPLKNSGVRVVMPVGDGSSGIMLIGEAPGEKEDTVGEPFVGASGKFLNGILLPSVDLTRKNIYLTNIVKCRPPANRDPTEEEKNAWSLVLVAEIMAIKPQLIVCLGRHSMGFFLPEAKISQIHGQVQNVTLTPSLSIPVLALYHPAAALYNPGLRQTLEKDFLEIEQHIRRPESYRPKPKNQQDIQGLF